MSPLRVQLDRLRRRAWLVIAITALAVIGAVAATLGQDTTYTGRSTLTMISTNRAPEQDAPLAQGYAEYFNEKSYQDVLSELAQVPPDVTFSARTAATSPIIYIEATAPSREVAAASAEAMAKAFITDINRELQADREGMIADLNNRINSERALLATLPSSSPEASLTTQTILSLQNQINQIQADTSNRVQELQLNAGVAENKPNLVLNSGLGLVGGLILGCVAALAFAGLENRMSTPHEVRERLGLGTLAVVPAGRSSSDAQVRAERLKRLATIVSLNDLGGSASVAVTAPRHSEGPAIVAEGLAYYRAVQGERTLLVHADLHDHRSRWQRRTDRDAASGVAELLNQPLVTGLGSKLQPGECTTMQVLSPGSPNSDPYALFSKERFTELMHAASGIADLVVVQAPAITEAAEAQVVCASADRTILVIEEDATRADDALEALQLLQQVDATVLGVVIIGSYSGPMTAPGEAEQPRFAAGPSGQQPSGQQPSGQPSAGEPPLDMWSPTVVMPVVEHETGEPDRKA